MASTDNEIDLLSIDQHPVGGHIPETDRLRLVRTGRDAGHVLADLFEARHENRPWREGLRREGFRVFVKDLPPSQGVLVLAETHLQKKAIIYYPRRIEEHEKRLPEVIRPLVRGKLIDLAIVHELGHLFWNLLSQEEGSDFPDAVLGELESTTMAREKKKSLASPIVQEIACHYFTRRILQLDFHPAVIVLHNSLTKG